MAVFKRSQPRRSSGTNYSESEGPFRHSYPRFLNRSFALLRHSGEPSNSPDREIETAVIASKMQIWTVWTSIPRSDAILSYERSSKRCIQKTLSASGHSSDNPTSILSSSTALVGSFAVAAFARRCQDQRHRARDTRCRAFIGRAPFRYAPSSDARLRTPALLE